MKRLISVVAPAALALTTLWGCATSRSQMPPAELQDARAAYSRAESDPNAQYSRASLIEARQALDAAEHRYERSPGSRDVKTLGYVAKRKAEIAEADARAAAAARTAAQAARGEIQKEQATTARSERRAKAALDRLGLAAKEEPRGTVVTVPSANMFATNKAEILPAAKARLAEIATAVKNMLAENAPQDVGRKIMLVGYTDDVGSEAHNVDLSNRRASAVRAFFAQHGVDDAMMETEGQGEADPIGDNTTAQGRAQNRRVEIVITPPAATTPAMPPGNPYE